MTSIGAGRGRDVLIAASDRRECPVMKRGSGGGAKRILQNCSGPCLQLFREQEHYIRIIGTGRHWRMRDMKLAIALAAVAGIALAIPAANADDTRVGVG